MSRVVIIGAGILGAACGRSAAEAGHDVTILDPDPGAGATHGSFAWINATMPDDPAYNALRRRAVEVWRDLKSRNPDLPADFPGMLLWEDSASPFETFARDVGGSGHPVEVLTRADITAREPALIAPPEAAAWLPEEGHADPTGITGWFLGQALSAGARIINEAATAIEAQAGQVTSVRARTQTIAADHVVVAAGVAGPELVAPLGVSVATRHAPGITVLTRPMPRSVHALLATPDIEAVQQEDRRWRVCAHYGNALQDLNEDAAARWVLDRLAETVEGTGAAEIESITVRHRPIPADGLPAVGPTGTKGVTLVLSHSGVTLAPVIAHAVLAEIDGQPDPVWARYSVDRAALSSAIAQE